MASPISPALPTTLSSTHFQPQSWYQWTVSHLTVKTAIVGAVGVLVAVTLYRMAYSSESPPTSRRRTPPPPDQIVRKDTTGKTLPTPVPVHELNAQGFFRIYKKMILVAPAGYNITETRVRIEDSQGRRIATRYLPDFEDDHDIFSHLPLKDMVTLQFKITCTHPTREPFVQRFCTSKIRVKEQAAVYHVKSIIIATCVPLKSHPIESWQWQPQHPQAKTKLYPTHLTLFFGKPIKEGDAQDYEKEIVLENFDGQCIRRIVIDLKCHSIAKQLAGVLDYAFMVRTHDEKRVPFKLLIKDWKAAYQLENGIKIDYKPVKHDLTHFNLESVTCDSYVEKV